MKKRIVSLAACLAIVAGMFTACSPATSSTGSSSAPNSGSTSTDGKTVIRMTWWGNQTRNDRTIAALDLFSQQNPGVTFEPEFTDWSGYWSKLAPQAAAQSLPDLIQHDYGYLAQYVDKNTLLNLQPYVDSGALDLSDSSAVHTDGGVVNGNLYAVSMGTNALGVVYDPAVATEAGVELKPNMTWNEFYDITKTVLDKTGKQANFGYSVIRNLMDLDARGMGKTFYAEDQKSLGFDDSALVKNRFDLMLKATEAGIQPLPEAYVDRKGLEEDMITDGKTWTAWYWSNQLTALESACARDVSVTIPPVQENATQNQLFLKPSQFLTVAANAANPEMCVKVLDFFTNSVECNEILLAERGVPISAKIREALKPKLSSSEVKAFDFVELAEQYSTKISPPDPVTGSEIGKYVAELLDGVMLKAYTPDEATKMFMEEVPAIMAK